MRYIGVDVGKKRCQACIMDEHDGVVDEFYFENTFEGMRRLLEQVPYFACKVVESPPATCGSGYTRHWRGMGWR